MREVLFLLQVFCACWGRCTRHPMNSRSTRDGSIEDPGRGNIGHLAMPGEHRPPLGSLIFCSRGRSPSLHVHGVLCFFD